jgi:hypothetical protein
MKFVLLVITLLCSTIAFAKNNEINFLTSTGPADTTKLNQILSLQLQSYVGKPVDSLLNVLPSGYTDRNFMTVKVGRAKGLWQSYFTSDENSCSVEIYIDTFQFLQFPNYSSTTTWNMTLAKKETISFIKVHKKNEMVCVYGCNNSSYYW